MNNVSVSLVTYLLFFAWGLAGWILFVIAASQAGQLLEEKDRELENFIAAHRKEMEIPWRGH